ncbi:hypothetical protein L484_015949 [Morus notabilis]|uniref:Protein DCL n=1 Tax=Morus notabilis TaxID=981085 RepID=W9QW41_9ROSA|nr:hypothetical protein L484_015949 [Morus notabilis]
MAEQNAPELSEANSEQQNAVTEDMELEATEPVQESNDNGETNSKRAREEGDGSSEENDVSSEENEGVSKKQKVGDEKSVEEERLEKKLADEESGRVSLGPKSFGSSVEMFDYFYKFLHYWPPNLNVNKFLFFARHAEPDKKIGGGIRAFQVRYHPMFKSRCFFLIRNDESYDDFSFRKCVDRILPLPEDMKVKSDANRALGGGGGNGRGRGARGGGRGSWRGRKSRN